MNVKLLAIIISEKISKDDVQAAFGTKVRVIHTTDPEAHDIRIVQMSAAGEIYITG